MKAALNQARVTGLSKVAFVFCCFELFGALTTLKCYDLTMRYARGCASESIMGISLSGQIVVDGLADC